MPTTRTERKTLKRSVKAQPLASSTALASGLGSGSLEGIEPAGRQTMRRGRPSAGLGSFGVLLAALASALVAMVVMLIGPFEHTASVVFSVEVPPGESEALSAYRSELLECAWRLLSPGGPDRGPAWEVAADGRGNTLRLNIVAEDPARGEEALRGVTEAYLARLGAAAEAALPGRSEAQRLLEQRLAQLRSALSRTVRHERDTRAALPAESPLHRRQAVRERLARKRRDFAAQRGRLDIAIRRLEELKASPIARHLPPDPLLRERAMLADVELQQALGELQVRLSAVRAHLLDVWQETAPVLEELIAAAGDVEQLGLMKGGAASARPSACGEAALERAAEAAGDYHRLLTTFAQAWTKEFIGLREAGVAPVGHGPTRVLDLAERLPRTLGDLLFTSSAKLTAIREQVRQVSERSDDQARHHVLIANLTRGFHALQSAHHRFEFAASMVRPANNFRLAAALKSADGLRRRTLRREQAIDLQLQREAREAAVQARQDEMAEVEQQIAELRAAGQAHVDAILGIQDRIDEVTSAADRYTSAKATAAALAQRIDELAAEIARTEQQLAELAASHQIPVRPQAVRVVSRQVERTPANLYRRMAYGWAAGATTFLGLMLVQRFAPRRRSV